MLASRRCVFVKSSHQKKEKECYWVFEAFIKRISYPIHSPQSKLLLFEYKCIRNHSSLHCIISCISFLDLPKQTTRPSVLSCSCLAFNCISLLKSPLTSTKPQQQPQRKGKEPIGALVNRKKVYLSSSTITRRAEELKWEGER